MEKENRSIITNGPRPEYFRRWARSTMVIDINEQLARDAATGKSEDALKVLESIATNKPFMLYQDTKRFTVIIPKMKAVLTFFPNAQTTVELLTEPQFQNRVKMQYVIYPNFEYTTKGIMKQAMKLIFAKFSPQLQITG